MLWREKATCSRCSCVCHRRNRLHSWFSWPLWPLLRVTLHVDFISRGWQYFFHLFLPSSFSLRMPLPNSFLDAIKVLLLSLLSFLICLTPHLIGLCLPLLGFLDFTFAIQPARFYFVVRCLYSQFESFARLRKGLTILTEPRQRFLQSRMHFLWLCS